MKPNCSHLLCLLIFPALLGIGCKSSSDIPEPLRRLESSNLGVQAQANHELTRVDDETKRKYIPFLIRLLDHQEDRVRSSAASLLGEYGSLAKDAVPGLLEKLKDPHASVRESAAFALGNVGLASDAVVNGLLETLVEPSGRINEGVVTSLGKLGNGGEKVRLALTRIIEEKDDSYVRATAIEGLGGLGEAARPSLPLLVQLLKGPGRGDMRGAAARSLGRLGPIAQEAVPGMAEVMKVKDNFIKSETAKALRKIGTPEAMKVLKETGWYDYAVQQK